MVMNTTTLSLAARSARLAQDAGGGDRVALAKALDQFKARSKGYEQYRNYYDGKQPLTFASERYSRTFSKMVAEYTENVCPSVVDAMADRLIVNGFEEERETSVEGGVSDIARKAWEIWRQNRMDMKAGEVHQEASRSGDAYVIVWKGEGELNGKATITVQKASNMTIRYREEGDVEAVEWAGKWWREDDKHVRVNMYFANRIERWITRAPAKGSTLPKQEAFVLSDTLAHPYGVVPVFHFGNNADSCSFGRSDLQDVLPIQDALNKSVADMLVTMEFAAYPQRWVTGMQIELDDQGKPKKPFESGIDNFFSVRNEDAKFGQFDAANLEQMVAVQLRFKAAVADVTGVPTHYLQMQPTEWPSGESLKTAEARFISKITDRQTAFGNVWEDAIRLAMKIEGMEISRRLSTLWRDASPRSDKDAVDVSIGKSAVGVPNSQLQRELGYSDDQIEAFAQEAQEAADAEAERMAAEIEAVAAANPRNAA